MRNEVYPKARSENLVVQTLSGETLVYDLTSNQAHCLNETSAFIWDRCSGELTVDEIAEAFEARFGQAVAIDLVELALGQLNERRLLISESKHLVEIPNRREIIKRIGLASVVAIPVIASLTAPESAFSIAANCSCNSNLQCVQTACPSTTNCNPFGLCAPG